MTRIAIFASGAGTNAARIIAYFSKHDSIAVALVASGNPGAGVLKVAAAAGIPSIILDREAFFNGSRYLQVLKEYRIDFIVLAGFLWKIPIYLIDAYPSSIINIHPALLPSYGGKGMYGMKVHSAVIGAGEKQSGITIHFIDEHYDNGDIIFQERCQITSADTPESLAQKIHQLEHEHFPRIIEQVIRLQNQR